MNYLKQSLLNLFVLILFVTSCISAKAQQTDTPLYLQLDLANRWIWRGRCYSEVPVIMPIFGYKTNKINASIFGGYAFERSTYSEVDFILEYQIHPVVKLGVTDFFGINKDTLDAKHQFFDLKRETTMHMLDFYAIITPLQKVPVSFLYSVWGWGADRDANLKQRFSQYFEARYDKPVGNYTASAFTGFTPAKGFYASHAALVNMGVGLSRVFKIGEHLTLPLKIEFVLNPELQNTYVNAVVTIR